MEKFYFPYSSILPVRTIYYNRIFLGGPYVSKNENRRI